MRFIILLLFTTLLSCSTKNNKSVDFYYVVKHIDTTRQNNEDEFVPPPLRLMFYGEVNFILIDSSRVFFHDNHIFRSCGYSIDDSKPLRLFLTADSIIEINIKDSQNFLVKNVPDSTYHKKRFSATIASQTDTIRNPAFKIISDYFESKSIKYYNVRLLTEEENNSINSKLNKTPYDPISVTFKNGFDMDYSILCDTLRKRK